jgi:leucine-zipper-like transcriptional regulator 1
MNFTCLEDILEPKKGHTMVYYQDKIIIIGGICENFQISTKHFEYNIFTKMFKEINLGFKRFNHSSVIYKDHLYIYGGHQDFLNFSNLPFISISLENYKEEEIKSSNSPIVGQHSCNVYKNKMIIFGGENGHGCSSELFEFNFETFNWRKIEGKNSTMQRRGHGSIVFDQKLFVYGGVAPLANFTNPSCFDFQKSILISNLR